MTNTSPLWQAGNGLWEQFLVQRKGVPLPRNATLKDWWHGCHACPTSARRKAQHSPVLPFCCYTASRMLCIKPLLIKCWLTSKAKAFQFDQPALKQVKSWLEPGNLKTRHPRCSVSVYWKRRSIYLLAPSVEKEWMYSTYSISVRLWYLRHLELLEILV